MFEKLPTEALQIYWWVIVALLGGIFLFLSFIQGGQSKLSLARNEAQKDLLINALGRKWELTFTTLVLFGGAIFAAFPLLYAVSFGGAYWLWMAILFNFIIQAVAYEYRKKPNNFLGQRVYEAFLFINGTIGIFLIGVALGSFFSGAEFRLDEFNRMSWDGAARGLEALIVPFNVAFGLMLLFLARVNANLYFIHILDERELVQQAKKALKIDLVLFLIFFAVTLFMLLSMDGYVMIGDQVQLKAHKFLDNFLDQPWLMALFLFGVILFLVGVFAGFKERSSAFWIAGAGIVFVGVSVLLLLGLNHTPIYPSISDPKSSLTLQNASGSRITLITMSYVSLMVPLVIGYISYVWKMMDSKKLAVDEVEHDKMSY